MEYRETLEKQYKAEGITYEKILNKELTAKQCEELFQNEHFYIGNRHKEIIKRGKNLFDDDKIEKVIIYFDNHYFLLKKKTEVLCDTLNWERTRYSYKIYEVEIKYHYENIKVTNWTIKGKTYKKDECPLCNNELKLNILYLFDNPILYRTCECGYDSRHNSHLSAIRI